MTDEQLLLEHQKGDISAMDELIGRYKNPVFHFAFRICRNEAEAQDVTQEVFLKVHQCRLSYVQSGKFSTWIFSICHNACISRLRRARWLVFWPRGRENEEELVDFKSPDPSPQEVSSNNDIASLVKENIQSLPFLQKEALILREYEKLDYAEIAKILNKPLGTVKILIHRARQALKEKLLPYVEEGGLR